MFYSPAFPFVDNLLFCHFIRSFVHFFVFFSLVIHQFLFQSFVDPHLSVSVYSLCFFILFIDSLCLFFYQENQKNLLFYLLFADALFLSALVVAMDFTGLFFVFLLIFVQAFSLLLFEKIFLTVTFLVYLSALLPLAFLWEGHFSFEFRLSLSVLIHGVLFSIFCFGWLFRFFLNSFKEKETEIVDSSSRDFIVPRLLNHIGLSLDLARKLKPILNSLIKYFPESTMNKKDKEYSVSPSFFSPEKGKHQLSQMRNFILDFIEYAEPETESLLENAVDLNQLLNRLLKKLETHFQRPEGLIQKTQWPADFKIRGSAVHLEKCFEHILTNSFEALKNQEKPKIHIRGYFEKDWLVLSFLDNGHGIESEDMKRLFDPLFSKRFGLKGLGLPYAQKIVKAHKAVLNIESSKKGTTVFIRFPLISLYDKPVASADQKHKAA